jgi:hypothetical protein
MKLMQRVGLLCWICLVALAGGQLTKELHAAALLRGPYPHSAAPDGMTTRWRTDAGTGSRVFCGRQTNRLPFSAGDLAPTHEHAVQLSILNPGTTNFCLSRPY